MVDQKSTRQDRDKSSGKPEKPVVQFSTVLAVISLLVSVWVGVSYWNLREDYLGLRADYSARIKTVDHLAKQAVALTDQISAAQTPKLKVINFLEAATRMPDVDVNTPEGLEQGFLRMQKLAEQYAAQGYILIDSEAVISAPDIMKLSLEELNGQ
jgi:hypothetical protein|tara:strand:+ start:187 stop:651 length:465 start_codon:yes stop_codon:yes gene_type:complete